MGKRIKINFEMDGEILPHAVIDFTKFNKNPVILNHHDHQEMPLGKFIDIKKSPKGVFGKAIFYKETTKDIKLLNKLLDQKVIQLQPGAYIERDERGKITKFDIYEVSVCAL